MEVRGEADIKLGETLLYRVDRRYVGTILLDRRDEGGAWDFNFDSTQTDPTLIQTNAAQVMIRDEQLSRGQVVRSWTADHAARRVMTEATITKDSEKALFDLSFGIGDTLGATDAVTTFAAVPGAGVVNSTMGLTEIPNFRTAKDEFRSCSVHLEKLGRAEFIKSWPIAQTTSGTLKNRTLKVIVSIKITAPQ